MKIIKLETFSRPMVGFVKVTTDSGAVGYGQMSTYNADISALVFHRQVARYALGRNPLEREAIVDSCVEGEYKFPGSYVRRALAGLDTALWDLQGKIEQKSVCGLLRGTRTHVTAYGSSMRRDISPADEAERLKALKDEKGFQAFKIRVGKICGHDEDQWTGRTEEIVPAVRNAIGDETGLFVDANSCYTPEKAIEVGKMLEDHGVSHFEEPCPYWEIEWTARVTAALDVPVAGGEQDVSLAQFRRMIDIDAVDIVQPDICYLGGLTRALRVATMAEEKGKPCTPHSANRSMVTLFTLHMLAAIPNSGGYLELSIEDTPGMDELFYPLLKVQDGKVAVPDGPGWGVEINRTWLEKADYQVSEA